MAITAYTVTATIPSEKLVTDYISWLKNGHVEAVLRGGAESATIVRITDPDSPLRVQTRYVFPSPEAFARYCAVTAPGLRAEGIARFGDSVVFERSIGEVI